MARRRPSRSQGQLHLWAGHEPSDLVPAQMSLSSPWSKARVHLLGIGGIGMCGIAKLLRYKGCIVTGCDVMRSEITDALVRMGIPVSIGHSPAHLAGGMDVLVVSAAIRKTNPELRKAMELGIRVLKYAQVLGWLMTGRDGVAVSGSHGKTTTTSMIAYALSHAGMNPSMLVGGIVPQLGGNTRNGGNELFVVEACEYDRSFLSLNPKAAVITNIDRDHLDYYSDLDEIVETFGNFAARAAPGGIVVANGDDPGALRAARQASARVETFGQGADCNWRVADWRRSEGRTRFRALYNGRDAGEFDLLAPGLYNIRNALACVAICHFFKVDLDSVRSALATFTGARRRFDHLGEADGVTVLDDYGHHPTEVRVTLDAARKEFPKHRLWCVFQPHQCSRTRILMDDFARSFDAADRVIVPDIYSVRDTAADRVSVHARDLVERLRSNGVKAEYLSQFPEVVGRLLGSVESGDLVMTMGAGPIDDVARLLLEGLRKREGQHALASRS